MPVPVPYDSHPSTYPIFKPTSLELKANFYDLRYTNPYCVADQNKKKSASSPKVRLQTRYDSPLVGWGARYVEKADVFQCGDISVPVRDDSSCETHVDSLVDLVSAFVWSYCTADASLSALTAMNG